MESNPRFSGIIEAELKKKSSLAHVKTEKTPLFYKKKFCEQSNNFACLREPDNSPTWVHREFERKEEETSSMVKTKRDAGE